MTRPRAALVMKASGGKSASGLIPEPPSDDDDEDLKPLNINSRLDNLEKMLEKAKKDQQ